MKRSTRALAIFLTPILAFVATGITAVADDSAEVHNLLKLNESDHAVTAHWVKTADAHTLNLVLDRAAHAAKQRAVVAANRARRAAEPPQVPVDLEQTDKGGRNQYFIGEVIADLRGIDPWFPCGRTLTMVDGRRRTGALQPWDPDASLGHASSAPAARERRIEVWLLGEDGTHIPAAGYRCTETPDAVEIVYSFSSTSAEQAVALAIRIDRDYYIEKLQPM